MDIASNIKAVRRAKGITPTMMAKELGIEATNYPKFENRGNQLTYNNLEKISEALGITVIELITWEEGKDTKNNTSDIAKLTERIEELERTVTAYERYAQSVDKAKLSLGGSVNYVAASIGESLNWGEVESKVYEYEEDGEKKSVKTYFRILSSEEYYLIAEYLFHRYHELYTLIRNVVLSGLVDENSEFIKQFMVYEKEGGPGIRSRMILHNYEPNPPSEK